MSQLSYEDLAKLMTSKTAEFDEHLSKLMKLNLELRERSLNVLDAIKKFIGISIKVEDSCCKVCYSRPRTHMFMPCCHASMCINCAQRGKTRNRCFICRASVEEIVKIYL